MYHCHAVPGLCHSTQLLSLFADRQEAAQQQQRSTLFAYKPAILCTGSDELPVYAEQQGNDTQPEIACRVLSDNSTELMQTCSFVCTATFQASKYSQQECSSHSNRRSLFTDHQAVSCLQAESVNELVVARTAAAADSALAGLTGGIGATVQRLRLSALTLLAELEVWVAKSACCCCA